MAITNPLKEFVIKGISDLKFYDSNGDMVAKIARLQNIVINDETSKSELRGGLGNEVILTLFGDRTCTLEAQNATLSMDILKIMTGNVPVVKSFNVPRDQKKVTITSNTATISKTPATGANITVYTTNAYGEDLVKLTKVASAPTVNQFSISGSTLTFASGTTGMVNIYFFETIESEVLEAKTGVAPIFHAYGTCILQSITNQKLYSGTIDMPNCSISPSISFGGANSNDTPDPVNLSLDLLATGDYPYAIVANEQ